MKIIIVGCGKVGSTLAEHLDQEGHDITIIDRHWDKLKYLSERIDVLGVQGNGASISTQREAGVKDADILIATTNSDELNLLCCLIAKKAGNCQTIARIRDPEYYSEMRYLRDELNLSMVINPELAAAAEIARIIKFPSAMKVDTFARGRVELIRINIPEGSKLDGMKMTEMEAKLHCKVLICTVERGDELCGDPYPIHDLIPVQKRRGLQKAGGHYQYCEKLCSGSTARAGYGDHAYYRSDPRCGQYVRRGLLSYQRNGYHRCRRAFHGPAGRRQARRRKADNR